MPLRNFSRRKGRRRGLRVIAVVALTVLGLVLASTAANLILERVERGNATPYGERVQIDQGTINVSRSGDSGPTLVLLTGPYVLAGHSIAGFTTLYYANKYPDEVSAVIGIDTTVPTGSTAPPESPAPADAPPSGNFWERMPSSIGLVRWAAVLGMADPDSSSYTRPEIDQMRMLSSWNFGNAAVTDETNRIGENARKLQGLSYPSQLPVLMLLAHETLDHRPEWVDLHERQLANVTRHELVVLDGAHYLHWTQSKEMAKRIDEFLGRTP